MSAANAPCRSNRSRLPAEEGFFEAFQQIRYIPKANEDVLSMLSVSLGSPNQGSTDLPGPLRQRVPALGEKLCGNLSLKLISNQFQCPWRWSNVGS